MLSEVGREVSESQTSERKARPQNPFKIGVTEPRQKSKQIFKK